MLGNILTIVVSMVAGAILTVVIGVPYFVRTPLWFASTEPTRDSRLWRLQGIGIGVVAALVVLALWLFVVWPVLGPIVELILAIVVMALGG